MIREFHLAAAAVAILLVGVSSGAGQAPQSVKMDISCTPQSQVIVGGSTVCGFLEPDVAVYGYKGIHYGMAERWTKPEEAVLQPHVDALHDGNVCPQLVGSAYVGDKDCLFVNVWTPTNAVLPGAPKRPVMVFIHGGGFTSFSGSQPLFEGSQLASRDVVVVTFNYRLGALGFLTADALGSGAIDGNFGLMDQQLALKWVQEHIGAFGGDRDKVTLFGESSGASSTALQLFDMPDSAPLFRAAIIESNPSGVIYRRLEDSMKMGTVYMDYLCHTYAHGDPKPWKPVQLCNGDPSWLKYLTDDQITTAQAHFMPPSDSWRYLEDLLHGAFGGQGLTWQPVVDGKLVKGEPYDGYADGIAPKPVALGTTSEEGTIFLSVAFGAQPKIFTPEIYWLLLDAKFHDHMTQILGIPRYSPASQNVPIERAGYENSTSAAMSNLLADYIFICGNMASADAAVAKGPSVPVYMYYFAQTPFFDLYNPAYSPDPIDHGGCMPGTNGLPGNVCHGNELPYVFNTLGDVSVPGHMPTDSDKQLAARMHVAWADFARDPYHPGSGWRAYQPQQGLARAWGANLPNAGVSDIDVDKLASCHSLWLNTLPYRAAAQH